MGYSAYKNKKNILNIEFHISQDRLTYDELFQKSGLVFPKLNLEKISEYIKKSDVKEDSIFPVDIKRYDFGRDIIEIKILKRSENPTYFLKSENGEKLLNEKDRIFFEVNKYAAERIENLILTEEKNILKNIDFLSLEIGSTSDIIKREILRKNLNEDLKQVKILTGLKLQKKYENLAEIDTITMEEENNFLLRFLLINILGIVLGIVLIALYEFYEKYTLQKSTTGINYE